MKRTNSLSPGTGIFASPLYFPGKVVIGTSRDSPLRVKPGEGGRGRRGKRGEEKEERGRFPSRGQSRRGSLYVRQFRETILTPGVVHSITILLSTRCRFKFAPSRASARMSSSPTHSSAFRSRPFFVLIVELPPRGSGTPMLFV